MGLTETEARFGPLLDTRDCGGCRVCCEHLVVDTPEFSKPPGVMCQHACADGCGIYETRYAVCRGWHCLWRHVAELPDAARPDKSGIMWGHAWSEGTHRRFQTEYIHGLCIGGRDAVNSELGQVALSYFASGALPVWVSEPEREMIRLSPSGEEADQPEWSDGIKR